MQSREVKKLFHELEEIKQRLDQLDTNGDIDEIKKAAKTLVANTAGFESVVMDHGAKLHRIMRVIERLERCCPLMKPATDEFESVTAKLKVCDEES